MPELVATQVIVQHQVIADIRAYQAGLAQVVQEQVDTQVTVEPVHQVTVDILEQELVVTVVILEVVYLATQVILEQEYQVIAVTQVLPVEQERQAIVVTAQLLATQVIAEAE